MTAAINELHNTQLTGRGQLFAYNPPGWTDARVLAANTAETYTLPTGAKVILFSAEADFWVNWQGATAAIPAADITDGTAPELNPAMRTIAGITSVSIISATAQKISISVWK